MGSLPFPSLEWDMHSSTLPLDLPVVDDPLIMVNDRVSFRDIEGVRVVLVDGNFFYRYSLSDREAEAFLLATLASGGQAGPVELGRAFGVDRGTVYRYRRRLEGGGARALLPRKRGPKGPHRVTGTVRRRLFRLKGEGRSNRAVGRRLGISEGAVRRALKEAGYRRPEPPSLPGIEEENEVARSERAEQPTRSSASRRKALPAGGRPVAEAVPPREVERVLARFGKILEAPAVPESGTNLRSAGVLLAVPAILDLGVLDTARAVYQSLKPGYYGLRSLVLTLLFMALLRIKRPESLKGLPPEVLGRHLGLDRSPEVKTVRRKLSEIAGRGRSHEFLKEIAKRLAAENEDLVGFLYVDGHVRAYHGKREREKTFVPRKRICMPATTDYWVNDAGGDPLFFVTTEGHGGLAKALPGLLEEVKEVVGGRRTTVVFDRGGWDLGLFGKLRKDFDLLTYRKRPYDDLPKDAFTRYVVQEGAEEIAYDLADQEVELGKAGKLRLVARFDSKKGVQIHILTTRRDLTAVEVVERMVARWRQENFFKYMREEYALDALVSYEMVPADPERMVVNPKRREIEGEVRRQRARVNKLEQELVARSSKKEGRPTLEGFKAAVWEVGRRLSEQKEKLTKLMERRSTISKRVPLREALDHEPTRLEFERKTFTDALKMMAYRAESGLTAAAAPHYRRSHQEARKLVGEALRASGDLKVGEKEICVRLEPLSSPHRTAVLSRLCATMSEQNAKYPGTGLVLRYSVRGE